MRDGTVRRGAVQARRGDGRHLTLYTWGYYRTRGSGRLDRASRARAASEISAHDAATSVRLYARHRKSLAARPPRGRNPIATRRWR